MKINLKANKAGKYKVMVSHSDLDGIGGVVLILGKYGGNLNWYCCEYGNVNERVNEILEYMNEEDIDPADVEFIIADISVDAMTAERLHNYYMNGMSLKLYDHHVSAEALNVYPWATVIADYTHCGTTLVFEYEIAPNRPNDVVKDFAYVVRDYDLWTHEDPRSAKLNRLLTVLGRDAMIDRLWKNPSPELTDTEAHLVKLDEDKEDRYFQRVNRSMKTHVDGQGRKYGVVLCDQYTSNVGHRLLDDITLNYVVLLDILGNKVSLRSKFVNVAEIAERFGGGGHKLASGFQVDFEYIFEDFAERFTTI